MQSHLSQVCGLKPYELLPGGDERCVTPLAGVRIETGKTGFRESMKKVTPLAGVRIETENTGTSR